MDEFFEYLKTNFKYEHQEYMKPDKQVRNPNVDTKFSTSLPTFNYLYKKCRDLNLGKIVFTEHGTIMKGIIENTLGVYDVKPIYNTANNVLRGIILIIIIRNCLFKFKFGHLQASERSTMSGTRAFFIFKELCKNEGINFDDYALTEEQAFNTKMEIPSPMIKNYKKAEEFKDYVHHLDLNHAWPSGTIASYPELEKVYKKFPDKNGMNCLNGYFQSKLIGCKFSHLAKCGISWCNSRIMELMIEMEEKGCKILGVNTDGIWYYALKPFHNGKEGKGFGQWKHDFTFCKEWYASSDGQYYFIDKNGKMNVRARGYYVYEEVKDRNLWDKEDYFKAIKSGGLEYLFVEGEGLKEVRYEGD